MESNKLFKVHDNNKKKIIKIFGATAKITESENLPSDSVGKSSSILAKKLASFCFS